MFSEFPSFPGLVHGDMVVVRNKLSRLLRDFNPGGW